jgi:uncharacterized membrane protein YhaH (DUF805 family)
MIETFKKYSNFQRLAKRSEYWGTMLCTLGLWFLSIMVVVMLVLAGSVFAVFGVLLGIAIFVLLTWINLATCVARCRDAGINPWFTAACFVPYVGWFVAIVIGCIKTENKNGN